MHQSTTDHYLIIAPFYTGSHKAWVEGYQTNSTLNIKSLYLPGRYWKWRMHGGAVSLAKMYNKLYAHTPLPKAILVTDMLDVTTFVALTRHLNHSIPIGLYFHENQINYPWSPKDEDLLYKRDNHYSFINYTSALAADAVFFNSEYHKTAFLGELPQFLKQFPDYQEIDNASAIACKSSVLPIGLALSNFDAHRCAIDSHLPPLILWNHRWEYDKNPEAFFKALYQLHEKNIAFRVAILGENYRKKPAVFNEAKERLHKHIVQFGFVDSFATYAKWLWKASILPVSSIHDFFGISLIEAMYCNTMPLVPHRLAYPNHFPNDATTIANYFYDQPEALSSRLLQACKQHQQTIALGKQAAIYAKAYRWQNVAPQYDAALLKLAEKY